MNPDWLRILSGAAGVQTHPGIDSTVLSEFETEYCLRLPPEHVEVLRWSNGIEAYHGFVRLFGIGGAGAIEAVAWNHPECWRFAWGQRCNPYWFFGETAWGDQYAYRIDSLRGGGSGPVYFLEGLAMTPEVIAPSFAEFFEKEFLRNAVAPYDRMTVLARDNFGPLKVGSHVVYSPSLLFGAQESLDNVMEMDAVTAMIIQGDIATQLDNAPPGAALKRVEPYEDGKKRMRLQLIWN
ncbi:MAG: SMI1/KNR4 family protein [Gemmataceae bacterium]|nr:SMI1/KNR4 family protein [Gemmataceae bacterium]